MKGLIREYRATKYKKSLLLMLSIHFFMVAVALLALYGLGRMAAGAIGAGGLWQSVSGVLLASAALGWFSMHWWKGDI